MGRVHSPRSHFWQRSLDASLVVISLLVGYLFVEAGYRGYLYYSYVVKAEFSVATIDVRERSVNFGIPGSLEGIYPPHSVFTLTQYDKDNLILDRHRVHINNLGWVSHYDYEPTKAPAEFRIAIVGDSLTASVNNEIPWPDVLQRKLNADTELLTALEIERVTVFNFGIAGQHETYGQSAFCDRTAF